MKRTPPRPVVPRTAAWLALLTMGCLMSTAGARPTEDRRNIIFILSDDHRSS